MYDDIIAHLKASVPALRLVEGAIELAAVGPEAPPKQTPAAYVLPLGDQPTNLPRVGGVRYAIDTVFGVQLVLRHAGDPTGRKLLADYETLVAAVRAALIGWAPPGHQMIEPGRGRLIHLGGGMLWWLIEFSLSDLGGSP